MGRILQVLILVVAGGCSARSELVIHYRVDGIPLTDLVRVETLVDVDPADGRQFFADQPYRAVATGVGIEVGDFNGTGQREVRLTEDATLGYVFTDTFVYTLLPPSGEKAPPLVLKARAIGSSTMIGGAPPLKATFGPGTSVEIVLMDQRCSGQSCGATESCCNGACQDVTGDPANCGACGMACGMSGDSCTGATCRCAGGAACSAGQTCCDTRGCVDVTSDRFNCGACGKSCNPGESCDAGQCKCGSGPGCASGTLCCLDGNCSATGSCPCGGTQCAAPAECCDATNGTCADLSSSNSDCGACGTTCTAPLVCSAGACACQGTVCAGGDACCSDGCRTLANDPANCGACGHACGAGLTCVGGQCQCGGASCPDGDICCNATCADPNSSTSYCGSCNNACPTGETCVGGTCDCNGQACVGTQTCCPDGCFDLQSSPLHCGSSCNAPACAQGYACQSGHCVQTTCVPPCDNGNSCSGTSCVCGSGPACMAPATCCGNDCFDLMTSHDHCMSCTHACGGGESCVGGICKKVNGVSCNNPSDCVSGFCADGVCCDQACTDACTTCNGGSTTRGTCSKVASGSDPHHLCGVTPSPSCGTNGQCSGGDCAYWKGNRCMGATRDSCKSTTVLSTFICNGAGVCAPTNIDCSPYQCQGLAGTSGSGGGANCASGPCVSNVATQCVSLNDCDPTCKCNMPAPDCSGSFCSCN